MADKSFGVKELNLLNASGTPTVTSPNNLNLNANTVAISTSCTIGQNLTVSANAGIASLNVTGVSTFSDDIFIPDNKKIRLGDTSSPDLEIYHDTNHSYISDQGTGQLKILTSTLSVKNTSDNKTCATFSPASSVNLFFNGNEKFETTDTGSVVTGILTATTFSGDPSNDSPHSLWDVVNNSASSYRFTGPGQDGAENNPDIFLVRGQRYVFKMNASGHPFQIRVSNGGSAYSDGVTNNGAQTGNVEINVQHDAPSRLYYQCTQHPAMVGNIFVIGGARGILTQNTTLTGSSMSFDELPSWAEKITILFYDLNLSGTNQVYVQLRNASGNITSGYLSSSHSATGTTVSGTNDGFVIGSNSANHNYTGKMEIHKVDSLKWIATHTLHKITVAGSNHELRHGGGKLTITGTVPTGINVRSSSSNTLSGLITINYE